MKKIHSANESHRVTVRIWLPKVDYLRHGHVSLETYDYADQKGIYVSLYELVRLKIQYYSSLENLPTKIPLFVKIPETFQKLILDKPSRESCFYGEKEDGYSFLSPQEDLLFYEFYPSFTFHLFTLDREKIHQRFLEIKRNIEFDIAGGSIFSAKNGYNCASLVFDLLKAGGIENLIYTSFFNPINLSLGAGALLGKTIGEYLAGLLHPAFPPLALLTGLYIGKKIAEYDGGIERLAPGFKSLFQGVAEGTLLISPTGIIHFMQAAVESEKNKYSVIHQQGLALYE